MGSPGAPSRAISDGRPPDNALPQHEGRFLQLAENASDIIFRFRYKPTRAIEYVNPALTAITGYTPEEAYANPDLARVIVHPDDRPLVEAAAKCQPGLMRASLTFRLVRKDGAAVWVERRVFPVTDTAGEIVAIEGIVRDITQHVLDAEGGYLYRLAWKRGKEAERDPKLSRELMLQALNASVRGEVPAEGPGGGKKWTGRYFVRREAWHVLDHAWEIEDRIVV